MRMWFPGVLAAVVLAASSGQAQDGAAASAPADPARVPDTVMFTIDELTEIQSRTAAVGRADGGGRQDAIENATLYLSTILYYGPQDWTVWVNSVPIGPRQDFQSFQVTNVGPDFVELVVPLSAQGMRPVRLSPNQTFVARTGAVVEGKWN